MSTTNTNLQGNNSEYTGREVLQDAFDTYRAFGLRVPPVPKDLVASMSKVSPGYYANRAVDLTDVMAFMSAAQAPTTAPLVAFGHIGHGTSCWWFCYQLITPSLALFMRLPYGGVGSSDKTAVGIVNDSLLRAEELVVAADNAVLAGARCIVVLDAVEDSFFQIGSSSVPTPSEAPIADALAALAKQRRTGGKT